MKTTLLSCFLFLASAQSFAQELCAHRIVESTGTIYVVPVYTGKVNYFFDDLEKKAHAEVSFSLDSTKSVDCFESLKNSFPKHEVKMARLDLGKLRVQVFKGLEESELTLYPEPGGLYHGSSDLPVSYSMKMQIKKAIEDKTNLITINGPVSYSYHEEERRQVSEVSCLPKNGSGEGVVALHKRLGEVIAELAALRQRVSAPKESTLDLFMTSCVKFTEVEADSFVLLESKLLRKTRLIQGKIPVFTVKQVPVVEKVELLTLQESSSLDY